ncbi:MAG: YggT family protein [Hydrogenophaga sp.]|nr:YggT family protein [Hydrogenophaga sp.]
MRIVFFLLETLFFFLVAAALLRAWMNQLRIHMSAQPGRFAIALTDWLVAPVRRILPRSLAHSRVDWGSLIAALLLALIYGVIWLLLATSVSDRSFSAEASLLTVLQMALRLLVRTLLQGLMVLLIGYAILSWVQPHSPVMATLERLCGPILRPVRRIIPLIGGVDLSVLVLIILLQVGLMLLG